MVDETLCLYRYRLGQATTTTPRTYVQVGNDTGLLRVTEPFPLTLNLDEDLS